MIKGICFFCDSEVVAGDDGGFWVVLTCKDCCFCRFVRFVR